MHREVGKLLSVFTDSERSGLEKFCEKGLKIHRQDEEDMEKALLPENQFPKKELNRLKFLKHRYDNGLIK